MALSLPYPNMSFVPLDILTAEELNHIVANYTAIAVALPVATANIANNAVTSAKLANNAVTTAKINANAVTYDKAAFRTYNASETAIGKWIDGKVIYRKVLTGTTANAAFTWINPSISNFSRLINVYGSIAASNGAQPINRTVPDNANYGVGVGDIKGNSFLFQHPASEMKSKPYIIVLEYIKTS